MRVSCRIQKLKSSNLSGVQKHNEREFDVPNADLEKSHLNRRLIGAGNLSKLVNNRINETKAKVISSGKNTSNVAVEIILSASPEYFRDNPNEVGVYDEKKMEAWVKCNKDFLEQKYGDNLICLDLHLDEATPHLHAVVTPLLKKEKSYRRTKEEIKKNIPPRKYEVFSLDSKTMFNRGALIQLQTDAALAVKTLGISRGIRGSKAKHTTLKEFYSTIVNAVNTPLTKLPTMDNLSIGEMFYTNANIDNYNDRLKSYNYKLANEYNGLCNSNKQLILKNKSINASLNTYLSLGDAGEIKQKLFELDNQVSLLKTKLKEAYQYSYNTIDESNRKTLVIERAMYFLGKMPSEVRGLMHSDLKQDLDEYYSSFVPQDRPYQLDDYDDSPKLNPNSFQFDDDSPSF